jgi:hypothetical protein
MIRAAEFSAASDRRKSPVGTFPPKHPPGAYGLSAMPTNLTLVRIEVFFASAELRQKTDFKSSLREQIRFFDKLGQQNFLLPFFLRNDFTINY